MDDISERITQIVERYKAAHGGTLRAFRDELNTENFRVSHQTISNWLDGSYRPERFGLFFDLYLGTPQGDWRKTFAWEILNVISPSLLEWAATNPKTPGILES